MKRPKTETAGSALKPLLWLLPLACLASYGLLVLYLAPLLSAQTGGGVPFDLRPLGYSLGEARAYLAGFTPSGTALYLGPIRLNDTVFPILFTVTLCLPLGGRGQIWFLPALAYGISDLAENLAVARLLRVGPEVQAEAVALASGFTQAKFLALTVAIVLALAALWRAWRHR
jgi:hypothetical protein